MRDNGPIQTWRMNHGLTRHELAQACGIAEGDLARIEEGKEGIAGELQDFLTEQGENVSRMASEQSAYLAGNRGLNDGVVPLSSPKGANYARPPRPIKCGRKAKSH